MTGEYNSRNSGVRPDNPRFVVRDPSLQVAGWTEAVGETLPIWRSGVLFQSDQRERRRFRAKAAATSCRVKPS